MKKSKTLPSKHKKKLSEISEKAQGQVFTPEYMVNAMLDWCDYQGEHILCKHITDNSCGEGAFLIQVVHRYIQAALQRQLSPAIIKRQLQLYIHGMDNDPSAVICCKEKLDEVTAQYGITGIKWRIYRMDTLACHLYNGMMDYVIGNPPYVRVHHLDGITYDLMQECSFSDKGMTDLYLAFFELSFRTLKKGGQLCYITPVSWTYSKAAQKFRQYILQQRNLVELVDIGHHQVFSGVSTYTLVSRFTKDAPEKHFMYSQFDPLTHQRINGILLSVDDIVVGDSFYLADKTTLSLLRSIKTIPIDSGINVKNGFATLADKIFISETIPESPFTIQAVKASTGKRTYCLFPYKPDGTPATYQELTESPFLKQYLDSNKEALLKRDNRQNEWWLYGRTQALSCVYLPKLSVNTLVREVKDIKIEYVPIGQGVYSGYYITAPDEELLYQIKDAITTPDFIRYVKALKKYKSSGYYTFSAKDLEQFLHSLFPHQE